MNTITPVKVCKCDIHVALDEAEANYALHGGEARLVAKWLFKENAITSHLEFEGFVTALADRVRGGVRLKGEHE